MSSSGTPGYVFRATGSTCWSITGIQNSGCELGIFEKVADIMCKPGSLAWVIPENSSRVINLLTCALFWYQDISTWERLSEHITTGLY